MIIPLQGANLKTSITQKFGEHPEWYAWLGIKGHNGIDLFAPYGTPVLAATNGTITSIRTYADGKKSGLSISLFSDIQPDGYYYTTAYYHLSKILVKEGQQVKAGDVIGLEGNSGWVISQGISYFQESSPNNKGTHLHFGVMRFDKNKRPLNLDNGYDGFIDPLPLLQKSMRFIRAFKDVYLVKDNKKTLIYNKSAFELIGNWEDIELVTQAEIDAIEDSGLELVSLVKE